MISRSQTSARIRPRLRPTTLIVSSLLAVSVSLGFANDSAEDHATHVHAAARQTMTAVSNYMVPAVRLVRDDGAVVSLPQEMNDGRAVVLNFIFTTCGSICPLMSQVFSQFERRLGADRDKVHLMSISIDPEEDTPARLRDYAKKFRAGPEWQHYTGTVEASVATQRAFDVYRGDKMSHLPVTLLRTAPGKPWVRINGFVTPDELLQQYRHALGAR